MTIPNNPATALYEVLSKVTTSNARTVLGAWEEVLEAEGGTFDFALRHIEVASLLAEVTTFLDSLADSEIEKRVYVGYVSKWHQAVVFRRLWEHSQVPPSEIIEPALLDLLGALGGSLSQREASPPLTDSKLDDLQESLRLWNEVLGEAELPPALLREIRNNVRHIEWLLANVDTYGTSPVTRAARRLLGLSLSVPSFGEKAHKLVYAAMGGLVAFLTLTAAGTEAFQQIASNLSETAYVIEHFGQIPEQKALPPGETASSDRVLEEGNESDSNEG